MKKVVVVVNGSPIFFEGDIEVINRPVESDVHKLSTGGPELLIIKNGKEEIAVFQKWDYWYNPSKIALA